MGDEIIKVLDALSDKLGIAVDWTSENVLPQLENLCGKAVRYELLTSVMLLIVGALLILVGITIPFSLWHTTRDMDVVGVGFIITMFMLVFGVFMVITEVGDIITCNVFPEKVIYELVTTTME